MSTHIICFRGEIKKNILFVSLKSGAMITNSGETETFIHVPVIRPEVRDPITSI